MNTAVLKNVTATSEFECVAHCYQNSCCRSAHFRKILSKDGRDNCELLHAVEWEEPCNLQENRSYDYIIMVQPRRVSKFRQLILWDRNTVHNTQYSTQTMGVFLENRRHYRVPQSLWSYLTGSICESFRYSHILIALLPVDQDALRAVLKSENVSSNPEATQTRNWFGKFDRQHSIKKQTKKHYTSHDKLPSQHFKCVMTCILCWRKLREMRSLNSLNNYKLQSCF